MAKEKKMTKTFEDAIKFAEQHVKPYTEEVDRDGRFPKEAYNELRKQGYMGLIVPKEYEEWAEELKSMPKWFMHCLITALQQDYVI